MITALVKRHDEKGGGKVEETGQNALTLIGQTGLLRSPSKEVTSLQGGKLAT